MATKTETAEVKFTDGPWEEMYPGYILGVAKDGSRIAIGYIYNRELATKCSDEETRANQLLVLAARDLFVACEELLENLKRDSGHLGSPHVDYAIALGKVAIARAKGIQ